MPTGEGQIGVILALKRGNEFLHQYQAGQAYPSRTKLHQNARRPWLVSETSTL